MNSLKRSLNLTLESKMSICIWTMYQNILTLFHEPSRYRVDCTESTSWHFQQLSYISLVKRLTCIHLGCCIFNIFWLRNIFLNGSHVYELILFGKTDFYVVFYSQTVFFIYLVCFDMFIVIFWFWQRQGFS